MYKCVLVVLMVGLVVGSACVLAGPAQEVLGDLAETERSARVVTGITSIGLGVAIGVGSYVFLAGSGMEIYGAIAGGLVALPGVVMLLLPSEAERACYDACDSEVESAFALERLAAQGRLNRYISGAANLAAGVVSLLYPYNYFTSYDYVITAVSSFGMAVIDFLLPSKEEIAYAKYEALAAQTP
ncbi:hypothetical protein KJ567_05715 [Candidatus Bipolaricaulota bacterium]|nr:hypothetical protein [Candidatus Bipolaricaulota bacterium]